MHSRRRTSRIRVRIRDHIKDNCQKLTYLPNLPIHLSEKIKLCLRKKSFTIFIKNILKIRKSFVLNSQAVLHVSVTSVF